MTVLQFIQNGFLVVGAFIGALIMIQFFWGLVGYTFYGGDDQHRAHSKTTLMNATISIVFLCIVWWLCGMIGAGITPSA